MEIKVNNEFYNPLLKRKEISLEIDHTGEGTPERFDIRKRMASKLGTKIENVFVVDLRTSTGVQKTVCSLQVYDDPSAAASTVPEHIVTRNLPPDERAKVKEATSAKVEKKAAKAPEKREAKPAKETEAKPSVKAETKPPSKPETEPSKPAK
jgi:small subunit ribosomal protein S24e